LSPFSLPPVRVSLSPSLQLVQSYFPSSLTSFFLFSSAVNHFKAYCNTPTRNHSSALSLSSFFWGGVACSSYLFESKQTLCTLYLNPIGLVDCFTPSVLLHTHSCSRARLHTPHIIQ
jgi:hypothetical protein